MSSGSGNRRVDLVIASINRVAAKKWDDKCERRAKPHKHCANEFISGAARNESRDVSAFNGIFALISYHSSESESEMKGKGDLLASTKRSHSHSHWQFERGRRVRQVAARLSRAQTYFSSWTQQNYRVTSDRKRPVSVGVLSGIGDTDITLNGIIESSFLAKSTQSESPPLFSSTMDYTVKILYLLSVINPYPWWKYFQNKSTSPFSLK